MLKQFAQKFEDMRRLIDNQRSASSVILSHSLQRLRRLPSETGESRNLFLLAVSGGMDSMCMADIFLKTVGADAFAIAHCNFHSVVKKVMVTRNLSGNGQRKMVSDAL